MKKFLLHLGTICFLLLFIGQIKAQETIATRDNVSIDLATLGKESSFGKGWSYNADTLRIAGVEENDKRFDQYRLEGKSENLHVIITQENNFPLTLIAGSTELAWSSADMFALEIEEGVNVTFRLPETSSAIIKQTNPDRGACIYNKGNLKIEGTGSFSIESFFGTAFYNDRKASCELVSGSVTCKGDVALYLDTESSLKFLGEASLSTTGDLGIYSNALFDVSKGTLRSFGMKEELSTAVIENSDAQLVGSLLQFTSNLEAPIEGVTLQLVPEDTTMDPISIDLPEKVISFALNVAPGSYKLIKPGTPDITEQGENESGETVTLFDAKDGQLISYINVQPESTSTNNVVVKDESASIVRASNGVIHVALQKCATVSVYNYSGTLIRSTQLSAGDAEIFVGKGNYIVRIGDSAGYKVAP